MTQRQEYRILQSFSNFELREYQPCVLAEVKVEAQFDSATSIAMSFKGKATTELSDKKTRELRAAAAKENIALSDETRICRFDPPFKPGFLQYNEIVIPVYLGE